jgi:hypothetical protein
LTSHIVFIPQEIHHLEYSFLIFLWAEHHFIVTASGAPVHMIGVVPREGEGIGTSVCELFSSRRGNQSWAINVATTKAKWAGLKVGRPAKTGNVADGANRSATLQSLPLSRRCNGCWVDQQRQVVSVHVTDIVEILATGTDGELRKVCLRLGIISVSWICTASWIAPNQATGPVRPHVDHLESVVGS